MTAMPRSAMLLAAGLGTRLRPLSETLPKPLVEVDGRSLLDHALDRLAEAGVERVVVNTHYKGEMIAGHLARRRRPRIMISHEETLLETGGGVYRALPLLDAVFLVVNADILWLDGPASTLSRVAEAFEPGHMDALLLLQRTVTAVGYDGEGDYFLDPSGRPRRRRQREIAPYLFAGIQILHRPLFDGVATNAFSMTRLFDRAETAGRLRGIVHDGEWYHIGTPAGLAATRERLSSHRVER
jgi:MurNAc alpha-1-phosphate uridylyltransferase